jgi:molybdate transport system permease protein
MTEIDWLPFLLSAKLALLTTIILVIMVAPLAHLLTQTRFPGKGFCEALLNLPLLLPPTVLGFYLLLIMGPKGLVGRTWAWLTDGALVFTFSGIVFASLIYSLPFAYQPMKTAFERINKQHLESAYILGLSRTAAFFRVVIPNAKGGLAAAAILIFVHTLGEFGVILMVGGSIPGETKVVSIAIYEAVEALRYRDAGVMSLFLVPICYGVLLIVNRLSQQKSYGT